MKPDNWVEPSNSADLRRAMADRFGGTALLAFSTGKDAIATWCAMRPLFNRIIPVHYELIPGLAFVQESLAYYEDFFKTPIIRKTHPSFVRWLANFVFQTPDRIETIQEARLPDGKGYNQEVILEGVRAELGLDPETFVATGVRACDSPYRRLAAQKHGAVNWKRCAWWPVYDWNMDDVDQCLTEARVKLPLDYRLWGRTFDGIDYHSSTLA